MNDNLPGPSSRLSAAAVCMVLWAASLPTVAWAQDGPVGPVVTRPPVTVPGLNAGALGVQVVSGIHMRQVHGATAFQIPATISALGVPASAGGSGAADVVTGTYAEVSDRFVPDGLSAALNTSANETSLRFDGTGLLAVFDRWSRSGGQVIIAQRPSLRAPWTVLGPVGNLDNAHEHDPLLVRYQGQLHLVYLQQGATLTGDLRMAPLDLATLRIGASTVIVRSSIQNGIVHSPEPIVDANGEFIGLSHQDGRWSGTGSAYSSHHMSFDLDPNTPAVPTFATPGRWMMYGSFVGGRVYNVELDSATNTTRVVAADVTWWTAPTAQPGGAFDIQVHTYAPRPTNWWRSDLMVGLGFRQQPLTIPGVTGPLGVDMPLVFLPFSASNREGVARNLVAIPGDPALSGLSLSAQSVSRDLWPRVFLGNTGMLRIR